MHRTFSVGSGRPGGGPPIRRGWLWSGLALAALLLLGLAAAAHGPELRAQARLLSETAAAAFSRTLFDETFLNPWFYGVFAAVLLLERWIPARPEQRGLGAGARQDFLWIFIKLAAHAWFLPLYALLLRFFYDRYLGFLTLTGVRSWPWLAKLLLALLLGDLVFYVTHVVRHKIAFLWHFHAVHHSQRELNFLTEYRSHPLDDLFLNTVGFIPLFMIQGSLVTVLAIVWLRHWHTRLCHANLRTSFGPFRYLLVTPQSHRVHHSVERRHWDTNFGLTLSLWDHLFGTQYRGYDEYPETGIGDETGAPGQGQGTALRSLIEQLLYPFQALSLASRDLGNRADS
jgi:sterol desaturase/sphingolipid hydroxylase (fatty acid hydroxylase superfamily)